MNAQKLICMQGADNRFVTLAIMMADSSGLVGRLSDFKLQIEQGAK